jgi:hypothetical protein
MSFPTPQRNRFDVATKATRVNGFLARHEGGAIIGEAIRRRLDGAWIASQ